MAVSGHGSPVLVLGNAGMDLSFALSRLPAPGETLVSETVGRAPGGKGLNQAVVAARAGANVAFAAQVGRDADGDAIAQALAVEPIARLRLGRSDRRTDLSVLMVSPQGENCIVSAGACADGFDPADAGALAGSLEAGGWLLLQGNLSWATTEAATAAAAQRGARVMLNAAPLRWAREVTRRSWDVLVVNESEAEGIAGCSGLAAAMQLHRAGARVAIVTLGAAGCAVASNGRVQEIAAAAVRSVDSTGAGDTFCGVLIAALARDVGLDYALHAAQRAAAITVTRPGAFAALPSCLELQPIMRAAGV